MSTHSNPLTASMAALPVSPDVPVNRNVRENRHMVGVINFATITKS